MTHFSVSKIKRYFSALLFVMAIVLPTQLVAEELDSIVAIVDDDVITKTQLQQRIGQVRIELQQANQSVPSAAELKKQILNTMIDESLELAEAKRLGIEADDAAVNQAIETIAERNNTDLVTLKSALEAQGLNYQEYRQNIQRQMIISQVQQLAVGPEVKVTDQEIENYLNTEGPVEKDILEYHVQDILIPLSSEPTPEQLSAAKEKAQSILDELSKGVEFSRIAVMESSGQFALKGGDLGWRSSAQLPELFAEQLNKMKQGDVSPVLRAANGLHIIKLVGVRSESGDYIVQQTHVRQILIKTTPVKNGQEVVTELKKIRLSILQGADFKQMAQQYSEGPSAAQGGDIGWVTNDVLVKSFAEAMDKLKEGQISQPVKTEYGWHIIEVLGRRQLDDSKEFHRNQVREAIYQRKFEAGVQNWIQQLKSSAYINIMDS